MALHSKIGSWAHLRLHPLGLVRRFIARRSHQRERSVSRVVKWGTTGALEPPRSSMNFQQQIGIQILSLWQSSHPWYLGIRLDIFTMEQEPDLAQKVDQVKEDLAEATVITALANGMNLRMTADMHKRHDRYQVPHRWLPGTCAA